MGLAHLTSQSRHRDPHPVIEQQGQPIPRALGRRRCLFRAEAEIPRRDASRRVRVAVGADPLHLPEASGERAHEAGRESPVALHEERDGPFAVAGA